MTITIDKTGETMVDAEGFTGQSCEAATQAIRERIGGEETAVELKEEWYDEHEHEGL